MLPRIRPPFQTFKRSFSSTACVNGQTSNIGRQAITFPDSVTITPSPKSLAVDGPLGTTSVPLKPFMRLDFPQPSKLLVTVEDPRIKVQRQMWGLTRTLINNAVIGMTEGFRTPVFLVGVGYRAALEPDPRGTTEGGNGERLNMKLGFSHSVYIPVPSYIKAEVPVPTTIILSCTDKHLLGLFAAKIRKWRPPEPYKGKGVFVGNESIRIKAVKKK